MYQILNICVDMCFKICWAKFFNLREFVLTHVILTSGVWGSVALGSKKWLALSFKHQGLWATPGEAHRLPGA